MNRRAVIIGAGLGGLAAALRLQSRGWQVTVCEASSTFGGKMNRWIKQGYTFDTGPSLITMPWVFADLMEAAGSRLEDHLELVPLHPLSRYVYDDGTAFTYTSSLPDWLRTLEQISTPADRAGFLRFLELGSRLWEVSKQTFLKRTPYDPPGRGDGAVLRNMPLRYGWGNYNRMVEAHFESPYLRQLYNRYPTYVGSSPYHSPATLAVIPYLEYAFGGWYVRGGLYCIVEALVQLARTKGVELRANEPVVRIHADKGRVSAVGLESGEIVPADIVVMNGDAATLPQLLGREESKPRTRSMSGFVLLLGLNRELPQYDPHTIFFSADYRHEFARIFDEQRFPEDPTVYVNIPSRVDRTLAPIGGETLFVMANAPAQSEPWNARHTQEAKARVLARLRKSGFPDLSDAIVVEDIWTPRRIEECYRMPGGAIYGSDSHGWRNAFLRPRNKSSDCGGLYLVGGSTHPGGGTPTVLLSAQITCKLIEQHERA